MSDDMMDQAALAKSLNEMLNQINNKMNTYASSARDQATYASQVAESFRKSSETYNKITNSSQSISKNITQFSAQIEKSLDNNKVLNYFDNYSKDMEKVTEKYESTSKASKELTDAAKDANKAATENAKSFDTAFKANKSGLDKLHKANKENLNSLSKLNNTLSSITDSHNEFVQKSEEAANAANKFANALKSVTAGAFGFLKVLGSIVGLISNFFKSAMTLPFMVLDRVAQLGNALREDIVVTIGQAAQDSKEFFDSLSSIGQGIQNVANIGIGMLKTFENYNSDAVKLFGEGASGIANMTKETTESIKNMGHYSEYFGQTITRNKEALFHYTRIKRIMGLTAEQEAYYAQDAGINLMSVSKRIGEVALMTDAVGKQYGIDGKRLMLNFNKLRTDIALFSHLSDEELLKTTSRLTQMKISVEDASAVFKKFNTFEDAANSVAMLSQTFGMNLDAMDIIQANNPEDIINMFRDGMIATGRTFDELNRFEKQILADQTGMSQEGLKALMTLRDKGLTHSEAVQAMQDQTPEAQQLKAIKELSSSMKMLQKVMNFNSPFEAFLKGLGKNAAASASARKAFMSLSNTYQMIHDFALDLDGDTVDALTEPVILIVNVMKDILNSPAFKGGLVSLVKSFGDLATYAFGITDVDKIYYEVRDSVLNRDKSKNKEFVNDLKNMEKGFASGSKAKELYDEYKKKYKGKISGQMFLDFLKEFRNQGINNSKIKAEYEKLSKEFGDKYKFSSLTRVEANADGSYMTSTIGQRLTDTINANSDNFAKFFDLTGSVAGGIIKGAMIFLASGLNAITDALIASDGMTFAEKGKTFFETFFDWQPGELDQLLNEVTGAFTGLLTQTDKAFTIGSWFLGQFGDLVGMLAETFWFALKGVGRKLLPGFFGETSTSDILYQNKIGKKGFTEKDLKRKQQGRGSVDASSFDASDRASQESFVLKLGNVKNLSKDQPDIYKSLKSLESKAMRDDISSEDYNLLTMLEEASSFNPGKLSATAAARFKDTATGKKLRKQSMDAFDTAIFNQFKGKNNETAIMFNQLKTDLGEGGKYHNIASNLTVQNLINDLRDFKTGVDRIYAAKTFSDIGVNRNDSAYLREVARYMTNTASYGQDFEDDIATRTHNAFKRVFDASRGFLDNAKNMKTEDLAKLVGSTGLSRSTLKLNEMLDRSGVSFMKTFLNYYPERVGGLTNRENVQDAMVAKPGGAVDTIFRNLKTMTGSATQASSNISGLFASSEVNAFSDESEREHKEAEAKFDSLLANAKNKNISSKINLKQLRKALITTGLFDDMLRPDFVSPSTYRPTGDSAVAASYQDGKPAQFSHDEYPQGEFA